MWLALFDGLSMSGDDHDDFHVETAQISTNLHNNHSALVTSANQGS